MNNFRYIYAFIFYMLSHSAMAGIVLGGTRIIYPAKQAEVQIALKNKDTDKRYLVQSWVSNLDDSKAPFVITPPFIRLMKTDKPYCILFIRDMKTRCLRIASPFL